MALASDLMGLGMPSHLARREASGGSPTSLQVAAAGTTFSNATALGGQQYLVSVNSGTGGLILPAVGGDNGCLLGDAFVVNNATGSGITLYAQSGSTISSNGSNAAASIGVSVGVHAAVTVYPVTSTQWIALRGS